jgi:hypothetical protein
METEGGREAGDGWVGRKSDKYKRDAGLRRNRSSNYDTDTVVSQDWGSINLLIGEK